MTRRCSLRQPRSCARSQRPQPAVPPGRQRGRNEAHAAQEEHYGFLALQELFGEWKLRDLSPNFVFVSVRAGIQPFSSSACTLGAYAEIKAKGKKINIAYVYDTARGIKLFADQAFFTVGVAKSDITPFMLKKDAEAHAAKTGGKVVNFADALKSAMSGG